jgi:hypothetical protein
MYIEHSYTGTNRIVSQDDLALRSNDGDIILYPGNDNGGPGKAYVHWGNDATGSNPQNEITTAGNTQKLTNKTIGGNLHFDDGAGSVGYIHAENGYVEVVGNGPVFVTSGNDATIESTGGNIILNADGAAYIGNAGSTDNRIATIGDLNSSAVIQSVTGTNNQITANTDMNGDVTLSLPSVIQVKNFSTSYPTIVLDSDNQLIQLVSANYDQNTLRLSNGGNNGLDSYIEAMTQDLKLQAMNGNVHLDADGSVYVDTSSYFDGPLTASSDLTIGGGFRETNGVLSVQDGNGYEKFYVNTNNGTTGLNNYGTLEFRNNNNTALGRIYIDDNLILEGDNGIQLQSYNQNNINLYSNWNVDIYPSNQFRVSETLIVDPNNNWAQVKGSLEFRDTQGTHYGSVYGDEDHNVTLYGNSNVILYAETGNAYMNSVNSDNRLVKYSEIQELSSGLNWKQSVNLLSDTDVTVNTDYSGFTIDGHEVGFSQIGYRLLLTNQTTASENGIYEVVSGDLSGFVKLVRTADANTDAELKGAAVFVMEGDVYAATSWVQSNHYVTDFANQNWVQFSGQGTYIGSNSINIDGREINVIADSNRGLNVDASGVYVKAGNGINSDSTGINIKAGTGFDVSNGQLEFATKYGVRKHVESIGNGAGTQFAVEHNFGTTDVAVSVYEISSGAEVFADVLRESHKVNIGFSTAPTTNQYKVVVIG